MKKLLVILMVFGAVKAMAADFPACGPLPRVMGTIAGGLRENASNLMRVPNVVSMAICRAEDRRLVLVQTFLSQDPNGPLLQFFDYADDESH